MGNKNDKFKETANGENEDEAKKQTELDGLAKTENGTDVDEFYKVDEIVHKLQANAGLDDVQCGPNVPVEQNDSKCERTEDTENNECANTTNVEEEQNADFAETVITDSASGGLKMEETETFLSTHVTENNQSPIEREALNKQTPNTENEINLIDKIDTESKHLSKSSVNTGTVVNDLKASTDLDDVQCDANVPVEKIDSKSKNKKDTENNENNECANDENEQNADFAGIEIKDSTSGELKMKETTETFLVSTYVTENNQLSLEMEALNEEQSVTENEINLIDKIDLSKFSGDTENGVNDISAFIETKDVKADSFENDSKDSVENVPKEGEKSVHIVSEQDPFSKEIALRNKEDIEREIDIKISEFNSVDETIVHDTKHDEKSCDDIMTDHITELQIENKDKTAINIIETEPSNTIISMKYNHNNKKNNVDSTSKIDSTGEQETSEEEQNISIASGQEVVKTQFEQGNWKDEQKEISCEQHVNEPISQNCVSKESEKCFEVFIENGKDNSKENLEMVTSEFYWEDGGTNVQITGSFNNWESKMDMNKRIICSLKNSCAVYLVLWYKTSYKNRDDVFVISIKLLPGEYTYKYFIDGEWKVDESKLIKIDDAGQKNNVIVVAERMQ